MQIDVKMSDVEVYSPKTYAFGDIHGCFKTLQKAITTIGIRDEDTIVFCGDIVDRGPMIKETLDYILNRKNTVVTVGNHDISFIEFVLEPAGRIQWGFMYLQGLKDTLQQLGSETEKYAYALRKKCVDQYDYESPDGQKYKLCHSTWNWHGEKFTPDHTWDRWYYENPSAYADYDGPIIVHGHTPVGLGRNFYEKVNGKIIGYDLDGGNCFGGPLACLRVMCLTDGKVYEQPNVD